MQGRTINSSAWKISKVTATNAKGKGVPGALTKHHVMQFCTQVEVQIHLFLTFVLHQGRWPSFMPPHLTLRKRPHTHWKGRWVHPKELANQVTYNCAELDYI